MLQKMGNIIIALLILLSSTGLVISQHFCNDQLVETAINSEAESCCDDGNCCTTNTVLIQLDEDAVNQTQLQLPASEINQLFLPVIIAFLNNQLSDAPVKEILQMAAPPPAEIKTFLAFIQNYRL
ncbi:HYC_CC_PP family protein [Roseimarinus sediminis]|jgi:hypothetical protein|uniref:HYC_CC_PP family protein n=1 Tax=Roseimarinus sediminis TaxID=1610899 RepID=UPI003D1BCB5E